MYFTRPAPVTVTYDQETHQLVIITDDKTMEEVNKIIKRLDVPKPQVLIRVVFLEVQHNDDLDIGLEGTYGNNNNSSGVGSVVLANAAGNLVTNFFNQGPVVNASQNLNLAAQGTTGSQIGPNTMPTGAGIYTVLGNNYNATLRAIAAAGRSTVLSRPSIMVRNNQPATISVGQSVPIITSVTYAANTGTPIVSPTYTSVGVILQVTPSITADGLVEMIVAPQISSLSSQSVAIAPGFNAPVIDQRTANTVVVAPDGETVIIGGLMESSKASVVTKIPILGDIPFLGAAFRRTQKDRTRTELIIFLTPHVVRMPSELAGVSTGEARDARLAPTSFKEEELDQFIGNGFKFPLPPPAKPVKH